MLTRYNKYLALLKETTGIVTTFLVFFSCTERVWDNPNDPGSDNYNGGQNNALQFGSVADIDGNTYKTIKIGTQTWMAENLRYLPSVSPYNIPFTDSVPSYHIFGYVGDNIQEAKDYIYNGQNIYKTSGVLYNFAAAMTACPTGWHCPTKSDWIKLNEFIRTNNSLGESYEFTVTLGFTTLNWPGVSPYLRSGGFFNGNNKYGFSAVPTGFIKRYNDDTFGGIYDREAYFWSATRNEDNSIGHLVLNSLEESMYSLNNNNINAFAVRCIKD